MKLNNPAVAFTAALLCLLLGGQAQAQSQPVTISIEAEVANVDDHSNLLGGSINVGDMLTGTYTYDLATPDSNSAPTVGDYRHTTFPYGIVVTGGGFTFQTDPDNVDFLVEIVNDHGNPASDNYLLRSYTNSSFACPTSDDPERQCVVEHISWQLDDPTLMALDSENLPADPPNLDDWQSVFGLSITGCVLDEWGWCDYYNEFFIRAHVFSAELVGGETVVIQDCDSGVPNYSLEDDSTISELVAECEEGAKNHGQYRRCVSSVGNGLQQDGILTGPDKDAILACAAQADIP